jgi:type III pantothenate kinase
VGELICAVDIGNSNITVGIYKKNQKPQIINSFRLSSDMMKTEDEYAVLILDILKLFEIPKDDIEGFCISSVVPPLQGTFESFVKKYFSHSRLVVVGPGVKTGIPVIYNPPTDVGADRVANAVGAWEKYAKKMKPKKPIVVVDFGTAITFDCISQKGEYIGGAIFPGIYLAVESLFKKTAKLPSILVKKPDEVIGKSTSHSMQSGIVYGYASMVDGMIEKISQEMGNEVFSIATGGYSYLIASLCKKISCVDETITLDGLFFIYMKNV